MNNASLELGGTNWAEKDGNILGYSVGDTSGNFSPQEFTFARGSNLSATRIDRAGLIVKGRENVLLQSNQFDTTWAAGGTITIVGGQSDKDGGTDAWLLSKTSAWSYLRQSITPSGVNTFSVYAKANASSYMLMRVSGVSNPIVYFDLSSGAVSLELNNIVATIESVGSGWYRCSIVTDISITDVRVYPTEVNTAGAATGSIYIQDAQVELGLTASPYIETTTTTAQAGVLENTPRLNYTTGVANPYLLLEPSRTNLFSQSEYIESLFIISGGGSGGSFTANYGESPEGFDNSVRVQVTNTTGHFYYSMSLTAGTQYAVSCYYKGTSGEKANLRAISTSGGTSANNLITFNGSWQRETILFTAGTAANYVYVYDARAGNSTATDFEVFGFQVEAGSYPTSYIPTYSVSATRAADNCSKTNASGEIDSTEGVLYAEVAALDNPTAQEIALSISEGQSGANRLLIRMKTDGKIGVVLRVANTTQASIDSNVLNQSVKHKIALKWKVNDIAFWIDGIEVGTDNSANVFAANTLDEISFNQGNGTNPFYGKVNALQVYKEALTDAELATLTTI